MNNLHLLEKMLLWSVPPFSSLPQSNFLGKGYISYAPWQFKWMILKIEINYSFYMNFDALCVYKEVDKF